MSTFRNDNAILSKHNLRLPNKANYLLHESIANKLNHYHEPSQTSVFWRIIQVTELGLALC